MNTKGLIKKLEELQLCVELPIDNFTVLYINKREQREVIETLKQLQIDNRDLKEELEVWEEGH